MRSGFISPLSLVTQKELISFLFKVLIVKCDGNLHLLELSAKYPILISMNTGAWSLICIETISPEGINPIDYKGMKK